MPKKEINNYFFYKIVCLDSNIDLCYVGSTANWKARNHNHKSRCNNENCSKTYNIKLYKTIRENGGWDNFKMVQVGTREQLTKREAEQIEDEYRITLKANMNDMRCYRLIETTEQYRKEDTKNYRENNKNKIQNYRQENRNKINDNQNIKVKCVCGCEVGKTNLLRHKKTEKHILKMNEVIE